MSSEASKSSWNDSEMYYRSNKRRCLDDRNLQPSSSSVYNAVHALKEEVSRLRQEITAMDQNISEVFKDIYQILKVVLPLEREIARIKEDIASCEKLIPMLQDSNMLLSQQLHEYPRLLPIINPSDPPFTNREILVEYATMLQQVLTEKEPQLKEQEVLLQKKHGLVNAIANPCWEKKKILKSKRKLLQSYTY